MFARLAFVFALALSALAHAATPDQIAKARAEADALIKATDATDLFENVTTSDLPAVRHLASGMVCTFAPGAAFNEVYVFPDKPRGEHVSCKTTIDGFDLGFFANHYPNEVMTAEHELRTAVAARLVRQPPITKWQGSEPFAAVEREGLPKHVTARVATEQDGQKSYYRMSIAIVGSWSLFQLAIGPADKALAGDQLAETRMVDTLSTIVHPTKP